jgi:hypothetical protein
MQRDLHKEMKKGWEMPRNRPKIKGYRAFLKAKKKASSVIGLNRQGF